MTETSAVTTRTRRPPAGGRIRSVLGKHPLTSYFVLAYALSWLVSLPYILSVWGVVVPGAMVGFTLKQWVGPAAAAMAMALVTGGRTGLRRLRASGRQWRVGGGWYVVVLMGVPLELLAGALLVGGLPSAVPAFGLELPASYLGYFVLVFLAVGLPRNWAGAGSHFRACSPGSALWPAA